MSPNPGQPPADWRAPTRSYFVTGTARSGSSYLCQLLASTGQLGNPIEYLNRENVRRHHPGFATATIPELLRLAGRSASANGVVGIKLFAEQFDACAQEADLLAWYPGARFVHLERRDILGQAISHVRAIQTGYWKDHGRPRETRPIAFDGPTIATCMTRIALANARWALWFAANGVAPLRLVYEDIIAAPAATVAAVARHVGLDGPVAPDEVRVTAKIQRDDESEAWRRRFVAEDGNLARLPELPPGTPQPAATAPAAAPAPPQATREDGLLGRIVARLLGRPVRR